MHTAPVTLAEHLRIQRQVRKIVQGEAASAVGVDPKTYKAWETEGRLPASHNWPAIIAFLGVDPIVSTPTSVSEIVSAVRRRRGLTAEELGKLLGVDKLTVRAWEVGRRSPQGRVADRLEGLLKNEIVALEATQLPRV
jgi:DNA-binding XRE family transcriptional regulator